MEEMLNELMKTVQMNKRMAQAAQKSNKIPGKLGIMESFWKGNLEAWKEMEDRLEVIQKDLTND